MDDDTAGSAEVNRRRQRRGFGVSLALGLLAFGLLAAACGGSNDPGAAGAGRPATAAAPSDAAGSGPSGQASQAQQRQLGLELARCMRSHGLPSFPDPSPSGGELQAIENSGINTDTPTYQSALQACKEYTQAGNLTPAQSAAENAKGLELSQCMRSHGVPNFPDPVTGPTGGQAINLTGLGIDQNSPAFRAASQACQKIFPGSK